MKQGGRNRPRNFAVCVGETDWGQQTRLSDPRCLLQLGARLEKTFQVALVLPTLCSVDSGPVNMSWFSEAFLHGLMGSPGLRMPDFLSHEPVFQDFREHVLHGSSCLPAGLPSNHFPKPLEPCSPRGMPGGAHVICLGLSMWILLLQPHGQGWRRGSQG